MIFSDHRAFQLALPQQRRELLFRQYWAYSLLCPVSTDIYGQIELSGRQWKLARLQLERIYEPNTYTQNYFERFFSFLSFLFSSKLFQNLSGGRLHMAAKFSFGP